MADNIRALQKAGCRIIVDDVTYWNESPFQDGPIARAVNEVSDAGVLYFSSARNSGNKRHRTSGTWEGDFQDGGVASGEASGGTTDRIHLFAPGVKANKIVDAGKAGRVDLFWAEPLGNAHADYNLYVIDADGHVVRQATTTHNGTQDPYQFIAGLGANQAIIITKSATSPALYMHLDTGRAVITVNTNGAVRGHNASGAANAFSVAATSVSAPPLEFIAGTNISVETFSSDGPRRMFFKPDGAPLTPGNFSSTGGIVLNKPDITAADGITTSLPSSSGLNPFFGTSAAAPHAAAIAALLLSYDKTLTPSEVRQALTAAALAIESGAKDDNAGSGIVMASSALHAACAMKRANCPVEPTLSNRQ
jgi:subtilisin family serine protease